MRRLILFRHGKAETTPLTGGDRERRLNERGRIDSAITAQWLALAGFAPDVVLVSASVRTQSTWESASAAFPNAAVETRDKLYLGGTEQIMDEVAASPDDAGAVMVVGHNPGLQELALRLAVQAHAPREQIDRLRNGFPTSTACVIDVNGAAATALEAVYQPPRKGEATPRWIYVRDPAGRPA